MSVLLDNFNDFVMILPMKERAIEQLQGLCDDLANEGRYYFTTSTMKR